MSPVYCTRASIKLTMEMDCNRSTPFLDLTNKRSSLVTNSTESRLILDAMFTVNLTIPVMWKVIHRVFHRASTLCQRKQSSVAEVEIMNKDLLYKAYPGHLVQSVINKQSKNTVIKRWSDDKPVCTGPIPCNREVSETSKRISEGQSFRTASKTKYTLESFLRKMKPSKDKLNKSVCL